MTPHAHAALDSASKSDKPRVSVRTAHLVGLLHAHDLAVKSMAATAEKNMALQERLDQTHTILADTRYRVAEVRAHRDRLIGQLDASTQRMEDKAAAERQRARRHQVGYVLVALIFTVCGAALLWAGTDFPRP